MKNREREVEMLLRAGRDVLTQLEEGTSSPDSIKHIFEAIRVHNTTLRTEIAIEKLKRGAPKNAKAPGRLRAA